MKLVLTIDDSAVMRQMVKFTLESTGMYRCLEAEDGEAALRQLEQHTPDLIVCDINMPRMNGYEFTRALRQKPAFLATPLIMLTTENNEEAMQKSKDAGATGWMSKPFQPEKLLSVMKKFQL